MGTLTYKSAEAVAYTGIFREAPSFPEDFTHDLHW